MANCRDYCRHSQYCGKYFPWASGKDCLDPDDCPKAWKIEDLMMDAQGADEIPFCEDYDGPENEEV